MNNLTVKNFIFSTINSNNRDTSAPSWYISNSNISNLDGYAVNSFSGVNTVNVIDSRNSTINFNETATSSTVRSCAIPSGNYTITSLLASIGSIMTTAGTGTYTATVNSLTNLITITSTVAFKLLTASNACYYEIGFAISTAFALTQVATDIYDLSGIKQIIVVSSSFGTGNSVLINSNFNIICQIPIVQPFLSVINYEPNLQFINCNVSSLESVSFLLLDERLRILNMPNDFSISMYLRFN